MVVGNQIEFYGLKPSQLKEARLGKPFVILELENSVQDEIYYYPVIDSHNTVILLLCVIGTTEGWCISVSEEWINELNKLNYMSEEYVFYKNESALYAENVSEVFCLAGRDDLDIGKFSQISYYEKKQEINEAIECFEKKDIKADEKDNIDLKIKYAPSIISSTSSKLCKLYNSQGQGGYGLCWAAAIATIYNYLYGSDVTAQEVANEMGFA